MERGSPHLRAVESNGNAPDDESFLDDVFDEITSLMAQGLSVDLPALSARRPHLSQRVEELAALATDVAVVSQDSMPTIAGFDVVRELGRGGMGTVFLAGQNSLGGRLVALKVLPHGAVLSKQARTRFRNEANALAKIQHQNVVGVFEVLDLPTGAAYAMEWIDGLTLLEVVTRVGPAKLSSEGMNFAEVLDVSFDGCRGVDVIARWGVEIADALRAVHAQGLLHRDVKPSNVMIRRSDGVAVLTDFGLARAEDSAFATRTGAFLGTPAYAAPEQLAGASVDERTDVFGLGATLYHGLRGDAPHSRTAAAATILRDLSEERVESLRRQNPRIPQDLATIVETAMQVDPALRYPDAAAVGRDLRHYLAGEPIVARPLGPIRRLRKYCRRHRGAFAGVLLGGLLVLAVAIACAWYFVQRAAIPGRVASHVRNAQLHILDPAFGERIVVAREHGFQPPGRLLFQQIASEYDAALDLREDVRLRAFRETVALASWVVEQRQSTPQPTTAIPVTVRAAEMGRSVGSVDPAALDVQSATALDRRCLGLLAVMIGDIDTCLTAWEGLDLAIEPDPLVDAALGQLYLQQDRAALAWPRLERAVQQLPGVGFLCTNLADAALRCGDERYALRLLNQSAGLPMPEPWRAADRVRADALWQLGRDAEADAIYGTFPKGWGSPMTRQSLARWLHRKGDRTGAAHLLWLTLCRWPGTPGVWETLATTLERWWESLDGVGRERLLRESLARPGSFLDFLASVQQAVPVDRQRPVPQVWLDTSHLITLRRGVSWFRELQVKAWLHGEHRFTTWLRVIAMMVQEVDRGVTWFLYRPDPPQRPLFEWLSVATDGSVAAGGAWRPSTTEDGRLVAFSSDAENLVPGDSNRCRDVFVRDRWQGETVRLEPEHGTQPDGPSRLVRLSNDGRWVAFYSAATNWVAGDTNRDWDCFLLDRRSGRVECVSVDGHGVPVGVGEPIHQQPPTLSDDGVRVAFQRCISQELEGAHPGSQSPRVGLFVRDRSDLWVKQCAPWSAQVPILQRHALAPDGSKILFAHPDSHLVSATDNAESDVFVASLADGGVELVSVGVDGPVNAACGLAAVSRDGHHLLLHTTATNFVTAGHPGIPQMILQPQTGHLVPLGLTNTGRAPGDAGGFAATSGRWSVFQTPRIKPFSAGEKPRRQLRIADSLTRTTSLLTVSNTDQPGDGDSRHPAIDADGRFVAFESAARNLVRADRPPAALGAKPQVLGWIPAPLPNDAEPGIGWDQGRWVFFNRPVVGEVLWLAFVGVQPGVVGTCRLVAGDHTEVEVPVAADHTGVARARVNLPVGVRGPCLVSMHFGSQDSAPSQVKFVPSIQ